MVEKRTLVFMILVIFIWATLASAFAGYFYIQSRNYGQKLEETQSSLNKSASDYDDVVGKFNVLSGEYSKLYGDYSFFFDSNYAALVEPFGRLVAHLGGNYTDSLNAQEDLNRTYSELVSHYEMIRQQDNVTQEEFGSLLSEFSKLFYTLTLKELAQSISETVTLMVNVCMDYGNGTTVWLNDTKASAGSTLFKLTQKIANISYTYYPLMEPGHVLVDSINDKAAAYTSPSSGYSWIWYYWDDAQKKWSVGPVGCDAWLLKDGGIYKWNYEYWSWP